MTNIILCGCGALGSNIAMGIGRGGDIITLYDDDKVDEVNVITGTTTYSHIHVGKLKVDSLARMLAQKYTNLRAFPAKKTVDSILLLQKMATFPYVDLVIDCFDNIEARSYTIGLDCPTVHISIGEHGIGAIEWNDTFQLPTEGYARGENPVCTNQLGRNLILFTSAVASVIINKYLSTSVMESAYVNVDEMEIYR